MKEATIRISSIIRGNLYVTAKGDTVRCGAPFACRGTESGMCVHLLDVDGGDTVETRDGTLRPASMREQRDFWKSAFESLCDSFDA